MEQGIIKVSGTNLIQQTDRSIARYCARILFDHGREVVRCLLLGGSGFDVSVVYLDAPLALAPTKQSAITSSPQSFRQ